MSAERRGPIRSEPPVPNRDRWFMWQQHESLMETPGEWFLIGDYAGYKTAQSTVSELRLGKRKVPPGEWEYSYGKLSPEQRQSLGPNSKPYGIWARYLGPPKDELEEWT